MHGLLARGIAGGGEADRPGIVHRLDRDTSGLLVVARNAEAHRRLQSLVRRRELTREYLALVRGRPRSWRGRIEAPIGRDRARADSRCRSTPTAPREAVTHFEVVELLAEHALLRVRLETGRTHQIRVHLAAIDLPVSGDPGLRAWPGISASARQFLHATRLAFPHPMTSAAVDVELAAAAGPRRPRSSGRAAERRGRLESARSRNPYPAEIREGGGAGRFCRFHPLAAGDPTTEGGSTMSVVSMRELLEAGVHFGHQTRRWNPKMRRYIFTERGGIYIIDLQQTLALLEQAHAFVRNIAERGGTVLFVGTKKQAQDAVPGRGGARRHAVRQPPLARRPADELAHDLRADRAAARAAAFARRGPARAAPVEGADRRCWPSSRSSRSNLGGVADMKRLPDAVFLLDLRKEQLAVREARRLGLPVIGLVDTNCDPDDADFVIPGNDDAIRSCSLVVRVIADGIAAGSRRVDVEEFAEPNGKPAESDGPEDARAAPTEAPPEPQAEAAAEPEPAAPEAIVPEAPAAETAEPASEPAGEAAATEEGAR